jgi:hypothetical protein
MKKHLQIIFLLSQLAFQSFSQCNWMSLGPSDYDQASFAGTKYSDMVIDAAGQIYLVFQDESKQNYNATVSKFDGTNWTRVGGNSGVSPAYIEYSSIALDANGLPYIAFSDGNSSQKITVMQFNGSTWNIVGSAGFSSTVALFTSIAIHSTTPYVAYKDGSNGGAAVKMFNGTSWVSVGAGTISAGQISHPNLVIDNSGNLYLSYIDLFNGGKATVMKYNGVNWSPVGTSGFSSGTVDYLSSTLNSSGNPIVAFRDGATSNKATVMAFNGSSWSTVGGNGISAGTVSNTAITFNSLGQPVVGYVDGANNSKLTLLQYNGSVWSPIGGSGIGLAFSTQLSIGYRSNGNLVTAGSIDNGTKLQVLQFNSTVWTDVGNQGLSQGRSYYTAAATNTINGNIYVAYGDGLNGGKATVKTFTNGAWNLVGTGVISSGLIFNTKMVINHLGHIFVSFEDVNSGNKCVVMKYDGTTWSQLGGVPASAGIALDPELSVDYLGNIYVVYRDQTINYAGTVRKFNGTSWSTLGPTFTGTFVSQMGICNELSGAPNVAYSDATQGGKLTVKRFNGSSWVVVGSAGVSAGAAGGIVMKSDKSGSIYAGYIDNNSGKANVLRYNGSAWIPHGNIDFSASLLFGPDLAFDQKNQAYFAYTDQSLWAFDRITIMRLIGGTWQPVISPTITAGKAAEPSITFDNEGLPILAFSSHNAYAYKLNFASSASVSANPICSGNPLMFNATGATTYSWSGPSSFSSSIANPSILVANVSNSGTYIVTTHSATCSRYTPITVTVNPVPNISGNDGSVCLGKSYTIIPTGASTYTISGGNWIVNPISTTNYFISGTSSAGCTSVPSQITVSVMPIPTITVNSGNVCSGNVFTLVPGGANTYTVSGGSFTVSPLINSNYSVTGTSSAGCVSNNTAISTVSVLANPTISVNSGSICSGKVFTIQPTGATSYTYSSGSSTVSPMTNSNYSVTGTNSLGCKNVLPAISTVSVLNSPSLTVNSGSICVGGVFTITPQGAQTFTFSSISNTVSPNSTTNYSIYGTASNGCLSNSPAISTVSVYPNPSVVASSGTICAGKTYTILPSGASTYTYSSGTQTVNPTVTTNYSISGTSVNGCMNQLPAILTVSVFQNPTVSANSGTICSGDTFTINPSGASLYTITGGSSIVSPTNNSTYSITGISQEGCISSNTAVSVVTVNPKPFISVNSGSICSGNSFTILPTGANSYTISAGTSVVSPTISTTYSIVGSNSLGCISGNTAISSVTVSNNPTILVQASNSLVCAGQQFTMLVTGADSYLWEDGSTSSTRVTIPITTTTYSLIGTNTVSNCKTNYLFTQQVDACTDLTTLINEAQLKIYPNPTSDFMNIESDVELGIILTDCLGRIIFEERIHSGKTFLNFSNEPNGIYYLKVSNEVYKIIKQ